MKENKKDIDFRYKLKLLLAEKDIAYSTLAKLAGINHCTVYNFLAGRSEMTSSNLAKCFNVLNKL